MWPAIRRAEMIKRCQHFFSLYRHRWSVLEMKVRLEKIKVTVAKVMLTSCRKDSCWGDFSLHI